MSTRAQPIAALSSTEARAQNAFGALRLFFASAVIISHAAEIVDGSNAREPVFQVFGTITAGSLAVLAFFIISGYLITSSFIASRSAASYLTKRVARIYPGFLVAFWVSMLIVAPLGGATMAFNLGTIAKRLFDSLMLQLPWVPGVFPETKIPPLNGSMWTISYEFRCYLLVLVLGLAGAFRHRPLIAGVAAVGLMATCVFLIPLLGPIPNPWGSNLLYYVLGEPLRDLRLTTAFLAGAVFFLYRDRIRFDWRLIGIAVLGLMITLFSQHLAAAGAILFGGYLIFATAAGARWAFGFGDRIDASYGVYLYAWPATKLLNFWFPAMHPAAVALATLIIAAVLGVISFLIIEGPAIRLAKRCLTYRSARLRAPGAAST